MEVKIINETDKSAKEIEKKLWQCTSRKSKARIRKGIEEGNCARRI